MKFENSVAVWAEKYQNSRNILLDFSAELNYSGEKAEITIAADAIYRVYVNGKFAHHGPQRSGKGFWRVDMCDITPFLEKGINNIQVKVLTYGVESFEFVLQEPFLQAEVFLNGMSVLATGKDFLCRRDESKEQFVERYAFQRPFIEVWNLPATYSEELELVEKTVKTYPRTAPYPEYRRVYPEKLYAAGKADVPDRGEQINGNLYESSKEVNFCFNADEIKNYYRTISMNTVNTEYAEENQPIDRYYEFVLNEGEWQIFKFPVEDTGFISCKLECDEDAVVMITYDELLLDGDVNFMKRYGATCNVIPLFLKQGVHEFTAIDPKSMQYVKVLCKNGTVKVNDLCLVEYVNSSSKAYFHCDDDALQRVFDAAVNTYRQNSVDIFMDCPSRERAGWLCDSFFTGRTEKDLTGESNVERGFLENFFLADSFPRLPEGMLPMCYPSDPLSDNFIPNWAMFLVVELEEYIHRSGDKRMADLAKERLYGLEKYFCGFLNDDGLLEGLKGWVFVEWSQANKWVQDVNFPSNMMYYAMLKAMARIYDDPSLDSKAEGIKAKIRELSFNGKFFRDHQVRENGVLVTPEDITETCQYYAFFTGVADKASYPALLNIIAQDFGAGHKCEQTHPGVYAANAFIGNYLRMEVLSANGFRKQIIGEIKEYFDYMARTTGTLWEDEKTSASCNHGFSSHVSRFIFRDCLGISEVDEENKKVVLNDDFTPPVNARAVLPFKEGNMIIDISGGVRSVKVNGDYEVV